MRPLGPNTVLSRLHITWKMTPYGPTWWLSVASVLWEFFGRIDWEIVAVAHYTPNIIDLIRAPLGARAYPWILSKYFLCVRACVRPCMCPPTDKRRVCIFCVKTLSLCGIFLVFCSYLEYNAITPFSSYVLYLGLYLVLTYVCRLCQILLRKVFPCTEGLSM